MSGNKIIELKRPNTIYHVWHYCTCHLQTYDHSQATWNMLKTDPAHKTCIDNLKIISSKIPRVYVDPETGEQLD